MHRRLTSRGLQYDIDKEVYVPTADAKSGKHYEVTGRHPVGAVQKRPEIFRNK